ncbi:187-kDa microtubule-associated protein AIR9-like [Quillaja saponaria]|uniref:187-kDa microtubule-associated protein AIR9-like n=1 Tax=Quillaja saponaria TaxID=32244 RepID=A0AAD7M3K8_QUISA|nr:187-kDa microtubule-associated protein AIR9-like [Quillaja saponaria]
MLSNVFTIEMTERRKNHYSIIQVTTVGTCERRIIEVNRKRVKVIKPGSKTSFPTTKIRGSYVPPFHVELF